MEDFAVWYRVNLELADNGTLQALLGILLLLAPTLLYPRDYVQPAHILTHRSHRERRR
jgi:hypothetical protein